MKRFLFTMMTLVALVLVANTTFGQGTKTSPMHGSTFGYSIADLSSANENLPVEVWLAPNADGSGTLYEIGADWEITLDNIGSDAAAVLTDTGSDDDYDGTWNGNTEGVTTLTFSVEWTGGNLPTDGSTNTYLYFKIYDASSDCYNMKFLTVTPQSATFEITIAGIISSDSNADNDLSDETTIADKCPDDPTLTEGDDFATAGNTTDLHFRIFTTDLWPGNNWGFTIVQTVGTDVTPASYNGSTPTFTVTQADGSTTTGISLSTNDYTISSSLDEVLLTITVQNHEGIADTDFTVKFTNGVMYDGTTSTTLLSEADATASSNQDLITLKDIPTIGAFN